MICLLLCENLLPEAKAILTEEQFRDVRVLPYAAACLHPHTSWAPVTEPLRAGANDCSHAHLLGGCCLAGLGKPPAELAHCNFHDMDQCVRYLVSGAAVDHYLSRGAYLITPGWLRGWKKWLEGWGLHGETAREFFQESTRALVLLDTGLDPQSVEQLREFAQLVDLPHEIVPAGLDYFRLFLVQLVLAARLEDKPDVLSASMTSTGRRLADYAMVFELIGRLAELDTEASAIERIMEIFSMFCAPSRMFYLPITESAPGEIRSLSASEGEAAQARIRLHAFRGESERTESGRGFRLCIGDSAAVLGVIEVDDVALPEFGEHYINLGMAIADVCALAIHNARAYDRLEKTLRDLQAAHHEVNTLRGIIPICASCKKIRDDAGFWHQVEVYIKNHSEADFTHGICPDCITKLYPEMDRRARHPQRRSSGS